MSERKFKPGVYRHFKENKPINERMYYAIAKTYDIAIKAQYNADPRSFSVVKKFTAIHSETKEEIEVVLTADGVFRTKLKQGEENFVFYKALYGDENYYVRPFSMFMSPRDAKKYPQFSQYWRMEKIG